MNEALRNDIIRLSGQGLSQRRIAQQLHVSRHMVHHVLHQVATARDEGPAAATPTPGARPRRSLAAFDGVVRDLLERYPRPDRSAAVGGVAAARLYGQLPDGVAAAPGVAADARQAAGGPFRDRTGAHYVKQSAM